MGMIYVYVKYDWLNGLELPAIIRERILQCDNVPIWQYYLYLG